MAALSHLTKALSSSKIYTKVMMCAPTHFDVIHKGLNPYMKCDRAVNKPLAQQQWANLKETLEVHNVEVVTCQPVKGFEDMVFSANAATVLNNKVLVSNMKAQPRRGESQHYKQWFRQHGFEIIEADKSGAYCEGNAELSPTYDLTQYFYGYGQRSCEGAVDYIRDAFSLQRDALHKVKLVDARFYHLDCCLAPLSLGHMMYYPGAFDKDSITTIKDAIGTESNLIEVTEQEASDFSCNCVSFTSGDKAIIVSPNFSDNLQDKLTDLGYQCVKVQYDQFLLSGGAVRCSVLDIGQHTPLHNPNKLQ